MSSVLPTWRASISVPTPPPWSWPLRSCACMKRRIIFAALARDASRKRPPRYSSKPWSPSRRKSNSSCRSTPGHKNWQQAPAPHPSSRSSTVFCSNPTRTGRNIKPWWRPRAPPTPPPWRCCNGRGPSPRPTSFTGSASCSSTFPRAWAFPPSARLRSPTICRWHRCGRIRLTTPTPPRSTMRCRSKVWAVVKWLWVSTSQRRGWPSRPRAQPTWLDVHGCPRCTCRATKSPCCLMRWCKPTPCKRARTARLSRCM